MYILYVSISISSIKINFKWTALMSCCWKCMLFSQWPLDVARTVFWFCFIGKAFSSFHILGHVNGIYQVLKVNWWMSFEIRFSLSTKLPFCFSLCICHQNMHSPCTVILFSSLYPFHRVHFYYIVQGQTWQWQTNANANSHHATFYFYFFTVFHLYFQTHSFHHRWFTSKSVYALSHLIRLEFQ